MNGKMLVGVFVFLLLVASYAPAQNGGTILILDGSGSMWGQIDGLPKIEIAREAIGEVLDSDDLSGALGFMAYGHRREADCSDIEVLVTPGEGNREVIRAQVQKVVPRGKTPIGAAILQAARILDYQTQPATVVLVSDGIENCGVDICELAEVLKADSFNLKAHVIGFDLDKEDSEVLSCLANETDGKFLLAESADALGAALKETVLDSGEIDMNQVPGTRTEDIVVRGSDIIFLAGRDDVNIPPRGPEYDPHFAIGRHGHLDEPLMETFPPMLNVQSGDIVRILDLANGGIHFYPSAGASGWGPAGNVAGGSSNISPLGGISGYLGPQGALLGVFLNDENPANTSPPPALDFERVLVGGVAKVLRPELRQIFYVGDGSIHSSDEFRAFVAPEGASRLYLGIADGWGFHGAPGYYDDNDGRYTVRIGVETPDGGNPD